MSPPYIEPPPGMVADSLVPAEAPIAASSPRGDAVRCPVSDAEVYARLDDDGAMRAVYRDWITGDTSLSDLAARHGVPEATVYYWAERGDWVSVKRRAVRVRAQESAMELERMRARERVGRSREQLDLAEKLRAEALRMLDGGPRTAMDRKGNAVEVELGPLDLKCIADAARVSADVTARFAGVSDPKPGSEPGEAAASGDGKTTAPLVVVVKGGGLPPPRQRTVDVDVRDPC